jgi:hypothetical protein
MRGCRFQMPEGFIGFNLKNLWTSDIPDGSLNRLHRENAVTRMSSVQTNLCPDIQIL